MQHLFLILLPTFLICYVFADVWNAHSNDGLEIRVDTNLGSYQILLDSKIWLTSSDIYVHTNNKFYASSGRDQTLTLIRHSFSQGSDKFGQYKALTLEWSADQIPFLTMFNVYTNNSMILFHQHFPRGLPNSPIDDAQANDQLVSCFPSLKRDGGLLSKLNTLFWRGLWSQGFINYDIEKFAGGLQGGSPLLVYDDNFRTVVISPFSNFMVGYQSPSTFLKGDVGCGIQGKVKEIPINFTHSTIIHAGRGLTKTVQDWGALLLHRSNKVHASARSDLDISITHLGYYTDNGAYYYYNTEQGKNYQDTMLLVKKYHAQQNLPFRYYQLDSWWYFKGKHDGVKLWEPRPDIFLDGLQNLAKALDTTFVAHNRYWASDTTYQSQYQFVTETNLSLPVDQRFWNNLMSHAKTNNIAVYEQDWLVDQTGGMEFTQNNVHAARMWLMQMGNAAKSNGLAIQYCMPLLVHYLQSTEVEAVTQIRVSDDYETENFQWVLARNNMLAWALGLFPFKDTFMTVSDQPGSPHGKREPTPELQTLVAALTAGPIGPGDKIGYHNTTRIMSTCGADGILLKPDRPAFPIERTFLVNNANIGQIWETTSTIGKYKLHYLFSANLTSKFRLYREDVGIKNRDIYYAFNYYDATVHNFDDFIDLQYSPKSIHPNDTVPFQYFVIGAAASNGIVVLGDMSKYITLSKQRVNSIDTTGSATIQFKGKQGETVNAGFIVNGSFLSKSCIFPLSGVLVVKCSNDGQVHCG